MVFLVEADSAFRPVHDLGNIEGFLGPHILVRTILPHGTLPSTLRSITPTRFPHRMEQPVGPKTVAMRRATEDGLGEGESSADYW
jgi:hypothetical protein